MYIHPFTYMHTYMRNTRIRTYIYLHSTCTYMHTYMHCLRGHVLFCSPFASRRDVCSGLARKAEVLR